MKKPFIVGNWKMNLNLQDSVDLAKTILTKLNQSQSSCNVGIAPNFTAISSIYSAIKSNNLMLGAQNAYHESSGAFTGEISIPMLKSVGCEFVILGHSERRTCFGETNSLINKKVLKCLNAFHHVILCVGETLEEREKFNTKTVLMTQLKEGLLNVPKENISKLVVAYEPVWAIGTGKTASPDQVEDAHKFIREVLSGLFSLSVANQVTILYGGSVKANNATGIFSIPNVDGALVGGASLNADEFEKIINAAN